MRAADDDAMLVESWRRGDPEAARQVVARYGTSMTRVALALCPRAEDAEDVVQDALLRVHRSLASFDPRRGSLLSWLIGVTANRARQVRRGMNRYGGFLARMRREPYRVAEPPAAHGDLSFVRRQLAVLPAREREAFVLVEIEELTSAEAANIMGISDSTVRVLARRARARLKDVAGPRPPHVVPVEGSGR